MRRRWLSAVLLGTSCLLGASCASAGRPAAPEAGAAPVRPAEAPAAPTAAPAPVALTINYAARGTGHSGAWLAYEGGFFREQGLDVTLTNIPSTSTVLQAMVAGQVQLSGIDASAAIQATVGGVDVVLLFAGANRPLHAVFAQPRITEPAALRGGTIGITRPGSATHSAAKLALHLWGLVPDRDVAFRQLGQNTAILVALQADQIDAGLLSPPATTAARQSGYRELINLATEGPEYPSVVVGALRPWVAAHEGVVQRVARAYARALARFRTDKPWALSVYRQYLELEDPTLLEEAYATFASCCPALPYISEEGLGRLLADLAADEPALAGRQPSDFVDARFLRALEAEGFGQ